jgi:hypothetical protein
MTYGRICAVSLFVFAGTSGSANSQSVLSGCDAVTGLGANGLPCVELSPLDPNRISNVSLDADGGDRYGSLDITTLGQTYACREVDVRAGGYGQGALLIEDCGAPLTYAELGPLKPFYGTTGAPTPLPPPTAAPVPPSPIPTVASLPPAPPPTVAPTLPTTPYVAAPAPSSLPPVSQIASATLAAETGTGFVPLLGAAAPFIAGAAGVAGVAAAAASAGGTSASSTN